MLPTQDKDWKHLAQQASTETDPGRLMQLITELNQVLEQQEETTRRRRSLLCRPKVLLPAQNFLFDVTSIVQNHVQQ